MFNYNNKSRNMYTYTQKRKKNNEQDINMGRKSKNYSDFRMCPILSNHKFKMTAINIACIYEEHSNHRPTNYEIHKK